MRLDDNTANRYVIKNLEQIMRKLNFLQKIMQQLKYATWVYFWLNPDTT